METNSQQNTVKVKKKRSLFDIVSAIPSQIVGEITDHDIYGQPISLNFEGDDTFKTFPGGILSIFFKIILLGYILSKFESMHNKKDWQITQQTVVANREDLLSEYRFNELSNITIGIQLFPRRPRQDKDFMKNMKEKQNILDLGPSNSINGPCSYSDKSGCRRMLEPSRNAEDDVIKYLKFYGMFENKFDMFYEPYNTSLNKDIMTWKSYEVQQRKNTFDLAELVFNLEDVVLKGTGDSNEKMNRTLPRFQIRLDQDLAMFDSYQACKDDKFQLPVNKKYCEIQYGNQLQCGIGSRPTKSCSEVLNYSLAEIANKYLRWIEEDRESWSDADQRIQTVVNVISSNDQVVIDQFIFNFYSEVIEKRLEILQSWRINQMPVFDQALKTHKSQKTTCKQGCEICQENSVAQYVLKNSGDKIVTDKDAMKVMKYDPDNIIDFESFLTCLQESIDLSQSEQNEIIEFDAEIKELRLIKSIFQFNFLTFMEELKKSAYGGLEFEMVVYDEIEDFKDHNDPEFNYPYGKRKSQITQFTIDPRFFEWESVYQKINTEEMNYLYKSNKIGFMISSVCLEGSYTSPIQMLFPTIYNFITHKIFQMPLEANQNECEGPSFKKLKYSNYNIKDMYFSDDYSSEIVEEKILMEIALELGQFETKTFRTSTDIFDWLGDVGGLQQALGVVIGIFAEYLSAKFFTRSIATKLFILKKSNKQIEQMPEIASIKDLFRDIKISTFDLFIDPIVSFFLPFKSCTSLSCRKRKKILALSEGKLQDELNIDNLLTKIRNSHNMLKKFQDQELLNLNKDRVIRVSEGSESSSSSQELDEQALMLQQSIQKSLKSQVWKMKKKQNLDETEKTVVKMLNSTEKKELLHHQPQYESDPDEQFELAQVTHRDQTPQKKKKKKKRRESTNIGKHKGDIN